MKGGILGGQSWIPVPQLKATTGSFTSSDGRSRVPSCEYSHRKLHRTATVLLRAGSNWMRQLPLLDSLVKIQPTHQRQRATHIPASQHQRQAPNPQVGLVPETLKTRAAFEGPSLKASQEFPGMLLPSEPRLPACCRLKPERALHKLGSAPLVGLGHPCL